MSRLNADLRPFRAEDTEALVEVCTRTADSGGDATGHLPDDRLWSQIYLLPYLERHPDLAFVVEVVPDDGGAGPVPAGYIVGTDDSAAFHEWFVAQWWPAQGLPGPGDVPEGTQRQLLERGRIGPGAEYPEGYPAHLHIDLLPVTQGRGAGRSLMERLCTELAARGVPGVHATAGVGNPGALAFYPRVGFTALPEVDGGQTFVRRLGLG